MILMHGVVVMNVLNKKLNMQIFAKHPKKLLVCGIHWKASIFSILHFLNMVCNSCVKILSTLVR